MVICISHRMGKIMRISDDISVIRDGEYIVTHEKRSSDIQHLIAQMVGREMKNIWPARLGKEPDENVPAKLEVKNFSHPSLFKEVSFVVCPGGALGFFGLAGVGRSDVMKALFDLVSYHGTVLIDGREVRTASPKQAIDHGTALVTENRKEEGLALMHDISMNTHHMAFRHNASRMGLINHRQEEAKTLQSTVRMNTKVSSMYQAVGTLGDDNQQKIVPPRWLEETLCILPLDGPTYGVDVGVKFEIYNVIRQLATAGAATILVSSELPEVMALSNRLVVMRDKMIVDIYSCKNLTQTQVMTIVTGVR